MIDYERICHAAKLRAGRVGPWIDHRDLAQEAALRGLMGRKSIDGPISDYLRKQAIVGSRGQCTSEPLSVVANYASSERRSEPILPTVRAALRRLTPRQQVILRLIYVEEREVREVAGIMGLVPAYVSQLHNGALREARLYAGVRIGQP